jgi:hypothetical protein
MSQGRETEFGGSGGSSRSTKSKSGTRGGSRAAHRGREAEGTTSFAEIGSEAVSQLGDMAGKAGREAKSAARSFAGEAADQARRAADRQVNVGADLIAHVAESFRAAADSLDENVPQLAELARGAADRVDGVSDEIRGQSASELFHTASDFARRRPAVLFGAAAAVGYLFFRVLSTPPADAYDDEDDHDFEPEEFEGDEAGNYGDELGETAGEATASDIETGSQPGGQNNAS